MTIASARLSIAGQAPSAPTPPEIGAFGRFSTRWSGRFDRIRYRDEVKDGNHTHHSRWYEARSNHGITLVDLWERNVLSVIELELAMLPTSSVPVRAIDPGVEPADAREAVRWAQRTREFDAAVEAAHRSAEQQVTVEERRRVLETNHRSTRLFAADARQLWVAHYEQLAAIYARHRVSRHGLRPAPKSITPVFGPIAGDYTQLTDENGNHGVTTPDA